MSLRNSANEYGRISKLFHWLTALLILSNLVIGLIAADFAKSVAESSNTTSIARATTMFSIHKTMGVIIFFVAIARIVWAIAQPKPGLLNGDRPLEAWAAETVHWLLYGSLVAVPLSGWVHHSAATGYAPIWWPLGQNLPMVPKSESVAHVVATLHFLFISVLCGAIAFHVAGAMKHHLIDQDATLRRMLPGSIKGAPTSRQPGHILPAIGALVIWIVVLGGGGALGWFSLPRAESRIPLAAAESGWQVENGSLEISVQQMGSEVTGAFADWTAAIEYDPFPEEAGRHGSVKVMVSIGSLTLGSVTGQALGRDFLDAESFPKAVFDADLLSTDAGHVARGTLTIRDVSIPVEMPFDLKTDGMSAEASGSLEVDRRAFGIGTSVTDAGSLGFETVIRFALAAVRKP